MTAANMGGTVGLRPISEFFVKIEALTCLILLTADNCQRSPSHPRKPLAGTYQIICQSRKVLVICRSWGELL